MTRRMIAAGRLRKGGESGQYMFFARDMFEYTFEQSQQFIESVRNLIKQAPGAQYVNMYTDYDVDFMVDRISWDQSQKEIVVDGTEESSSAPEVPRLD